MNIRHLVLLALPLASVFPGSASATVASTLYTPASCTKVTTAPLAYVICDDGVPAFGGTTANTAGVQAVTVPAKYGLSGTDANSYTGLPSKAADAATMPGASATDGTVALDVDVSFPTAAPPSDGYPLLVFMHGCCSGNRTSWEASTFDAGSEKWHYNNAWFASRGYVVITYTARGFVDNQNHGSTGETQLDSRSFEINDFQHLACQIYATANTFANGSGGKWNPITGQTVKINPQKVVVTGGSYGGGFSWMALTDPVWACTSDTGTTTPMKLAAVAPRYGWTDLVYSLVPTGVQSGNPAKPPKTDGCDSGPNDYNGQGCSKALKLGIPKQSINAILYASGTTGTPTGFSHTTFPREIVEANSCLTSAYPPDANPACANTISTILPEFLRERSAYYQNDFFAKVASDPSYWIPVFNAATFTDPLFPPHEDRRMHNRLLAATGGMYPLQANFGDYEHFVQNKPKEWGDICGADHHVCNNADYGTDFNANPLTAIRVGVTTRLNRFVDYYAKPSADAAAAAPSFNVTASLTICPQKADATHPADEPGEIYSAARYEALSPYTFTLDSGGSAPNLKVGATGNATSSSAGGAGFADPVAQYLANSATGVCLVRTSSNSAPAGVVVFETDPLPADVIMLGAPTIQVFFTQSGDTSGVQVNARLFETVASSGDSVLASRGFRRVQPAEAGGPSVTFELFDNGWRFSKGNKIHLELAQDDSPYLKASQPPSSLTISRVVLAFPTPTGSSVGVGAGGGYVGGGGGSGALALGGLGTLFGFFGLRQARRRR